MVRTCRRAAPARRLPRLERPLPVRVQVRVHLGQERLLGGRQQPRVALALLTAEDDGRRRQFVGGAREGSTHRTIREPANRGAGAAAMAAHVSVLHLLGPVAPALSVVNGRCCRANRPSAFPDGSRTAPPRASQEPEKRNGTGRRHVLSAIGPDRAARGPVDQLQSTLKYCVSWYSSMPSCAPSRPRPLCLKPPNGAAGSETRPRLMPIMPLSIRSASCRARLRSRE